MKTDEIISRYAEEGITIKIICLTALMIVISKGMGWF